MLRSGQVFPAKLCPLLDVSGKMVVIILFRRLHLTDKAGDLLCTSVIVLQVRIAALQGGGRYKRKILTYPSGKKPAICKITQGKFCRFPVLSFSADRSVCGRHLLVFQHFSRNCGGDFLENILPSGSCALSFLHAHTSQIVKKRIVCLWSIMLLSGHTKGELHK